MDSSVVASVTILFLVKIYAAGRDQHVCDQKGAEQCKYAEFTYCSDEFADVQPLGIGKKPPGVKLCSDPSLKLDSKTIEDQISASTKFSCADRCENEQHVYVICVQVTSKDNKQFWMPSAQNIKTAKGTEKLRGAIVDRLKPVESNSDHAHICKAALFE